MSYQASAVAGSQIAISDGASPLTFTKINGVRTLTGPTGTKPTIDTTPIDATAATNVAGVPDYGQVTMEIYWDPSDAQHQALKDAFDTIGQSDAFEITPKDADNYATRYIHFSGETVGWEWDFSQGQAQVVRVTIRLSGAASVGTVGA